MLLGTLGASLIGNLLKVKEKGEQLKERLDQVSR